MNSNVFEIITPASRVNYRELVASLAEAAWPEFMLHDSIADENWDALFTRFDDYQFAMIDTGTEQIAATGNSLPLAWGQSPEDLPERGWDWAFEQAVQDHKAGRPARRQCALQVAIHPDYQGQGLSVRMIVAMRAIGQSKGLQQLIAPVRPSQKSSYPLTDIDHYISWTQADGLPFDAWLRVHARLGARLIKVCHESMTIRGSRADWTGWTGLAFPESGRYHVPGALNPIEMDLAKDEGIYIEPNVWIIHRLIPT